MSLSVFLFYLFKFYGVFISFFLNIFFIRHFFNEVFSFSPDLRKSKDKTTPHFRVDLRGNIGATIVFPSPFMSLFTKIEHEKLESKEVSRCLSRAIDVYYEIHPAYLRSLLNKYDRAKKDLDFMLIRDPNYAAAIREQKVVLSREVRARDRFLLVSDRNGHIDQVVRDEFERRVEIAQRDLDMIGESYVS
jgi:hypothetical protein